jgi:hypothetical protein
MNHNYDISLFDTLHNVDQLINDMTEVTLAYLAKIITPSNAMALKNLLIDSYIMSTNHSNGITLHQKRTAFKDWLANKVSQQQQQLYATHHTSIGVASNTTLLSELTVPTSNPYDGIPSISTSAAGGMTIPYSPQQKSSYSTAVFQLHLSTTNPNFDTVAKIFNTMFVCNVNTTCKVIKHERCRRIKNYTTQLFKCNCCTTAVILQFRLVHHTVTGAHKFNNLHIINVCIKDNMKMAFDNHFTRRKTTIAGISRPLPSA